VGSQSWRFDFDGYQGSRSSSEQRNIFEDLKFMDFKGPIRMKGPENQFTIFEDYDLGAPTPKSVYLGRLVAQGGRKAVNKYDLKKRKYIATTSMDAELSLVTANLAWAGPGKLAYDPFMGTGSFPLSCAHFGSTVFGSDMDGRSIRGKKDRNVKANFAQYGTSHLYLDGFAADVTNSPVRVFRCLDSIVCDPPYGVREGLKVLGSTKDSLQHEVILADGRVAHLQNDYIPPKKRYSFLRLLDDILAFSSDVLVDGGRLAMWMPVAGVPENEMEPETDVVSEEEERIEEYSIPQHPSLVLLVQCRQDFNKCESSEPRPVDSADMYRVETPPRIPKAPG
jgi:tRNA (guanine10-N2)-methyltransferase